jgi:sulfate adenylyltransferase subunit 1
LVEQTRRHSAIASMFGVETVVVCVNKMDLVNYDERTFNELAEAYKEFAKSLRFKAVYVVPIVALHGDNVTWRSPRMLWYTGAPLLELLENLKVGQSDLPLRISVQQVVKSQNETAIGGFVWSGSAKVGERVVVLQDRIETEIAAIENPLAIAEARRSVTLRLKESPLVKRGDWIVSLNRLPTVSDNVSVTCCWLHHDPLQIGFVYLLRIGTFECECVVQHVNGVLNVDTLQNEKHVAAVGLNDIATLTINTSTPVVYDRYHENRFTDSMILIDVESGDTVAAAVVG